MQISKNPVMKELFPEENINSKKRPISAATQFKVNFSHNYFDCNIF
jgi:hypothetical protein